MKHTLETANTRESELSANGNTLESWNKLLDQKSLGALAFVRNIRNMLNAGVSQDKMSEYAEGLNMKGVFPYQIINAMGIACAN